MFNAGVFEAVVDDLRVLLRLAVGRNWGRLGGGMMLFEAASMAEAQAIVAKEPLVENGCVNYELYEWRILVE